MAQTWQSTLNPLEKEKPALLTSAQAHGDEPRWDSQSDAEQVNRCRPAYALTAGGPWVGVGECPGVGLKEKKTSAQGFSWRDV